MPRPPAAGRSATQMGAASQAAREHLNNPPRHSRVPRYPHHMDDGKRAPRREDDMTNTPGGCRHWWWPRRRRNDWPARRAPGARTDSSHTTAEAVQLAIGLLTSGLDSPQLQAWAVEALIPQDAQGLGDFMAGLHVVSQVLLHELQEATGQPAAVTLQRLAILAETRRGTPSD
jgi:hypothetical protein